jgi:hypothetical protein
MVSAARFDIPLFRPGARKEVRDFWMGAEPTADLRAALKEGVINSRHRAGNARLVPRLPAFRTSSRLAPDRAWNAFKSFGSAALANRCRGCSERADCSEEQRA